MHANYAKEKKNISNSIAPNYITSHTNPSSAKSTSQSRGKEEIKDSLSRGINRN